MGDIYLLLGIFLVIWYFWYLRKVAEMAKLHASKYCKTQNLQFISIARVSAKPHFNKREGFIIKSCFEFEFSGDGQSSSVGIINLSGLRLNNIDMPAFRI